MTQYKSVIVPIPNDEGVSYDVVAETINRVIMEQAADGWEVTLAQEMENGNKQGFFANLFSSKKKEKQTLLVFKKEEEKPEPPKEFDYDKFEAIVSKGMDYEKMANVMKKVVSETEVIISKKSFEGLKFSLPLPALPMNESEMPQPQATFLIGEKPDTKSLPDNAKDNGKAASSKANADKEDSKGAAVAKVLFDILTKHKSTGVSYADIQKESKGKLPEGTTESDMSAILNAFVKYKMVKKDGDLFSIVD